VKECSPLPPSGAPGATRSWCPLISGRMPSPDTSTTGKGTGQEEPAYLARSPARSCRSPFRHGLASSCPCWPRRDGGPVQGQERPSTWGRVPRRANTCTREAPPANPLAPERIKALSRSSRTRNRRQPLSGERSDSGRSCAGGGPGLPVADSSSRFYCSRYCNWSLEVKKSSPRPGKGFRLKIEIQKGLYLWAGWK
jgi:hypothetical protein